MIKFALLFTVKTMFASIDLLISQDAPAQSLMNLPIYNIIFAIMIIQSKCKCYEFIQLISLYNGGLWSRAAPRGWDIDLWAIMFYYSLNSWFNMTAFC